MSHSTPSVHGDEDHNMQDAPEAMDNENPADSMETDVPKNNDSYTPQDALEETPDDTPQETPDDAQDDAGETLSKPKIFESDEEEYGDIAEEDLAAVTAAAEAKARYSDPSVMLAFYQRIFPWRTLFHWLNHAPLPSPSFTNREFAFTLQNDFYLRYQSFGTFDTLRSDVLRLNPLRFEIGPVYSANPRDKKMLQKAAFKPLSKELVFDIDLTDYDEIRTCCDKANICHKCWNFITVAIKVLDVALKNDFGFKHVLWVYSGRRGAHAWVCDKRAQELNDSRRRSIAGYLELVRGGANSGKKVNLRRPLHPHVRRSLNILRESFQNDILRIQDPWATLEDSEKLLRLLPDKALNEALRKKWESASSSSSETKWADIDTIAASGVSKTLNRQELREHKQDVVLEYMYPRLDAEVSKHLNHLLKSPFVVHPGTGRVCVPIDSERPEEFDPLNVPTVTELLDEINEWKQKGKEEGETKDWEKTSLKPYVDYFKKFVKELMKDEKATKNGGDEMEF